MSQKNAYNIRCPKCGHDQMVDLYESINVDLSPELKAQLLSNDLNTVACGGCGLKFRIDKPLLYNDPSHQVMIYLIPMAEDAFAEGEKQFADSLHKLNGIIPDGIDTPDVCLVFNRTELVERIFLFDAGLNERVVEYIKYMIYSNNMDRIDPIRKNLLFDAEDSTEDNLCFVIQDVASKKLESVLQYERKTYDALSEMFDEDEQTATLFELFPGPYVSARALFLKEQQKARRIPESPGD